MRNIKYILGHIASNNGVEVDPEKINPVKDPHNIKQLRAVLGLIGFYLNEACKKTLKELKVKLQQAPLVRYPNDDEMYALTTDASKR